MIYVLAGARGPSHKARVGHHERTVSDTTGRYGSRRCRSRHHVTQLKTVIGHVTASDHDMWSLSAVNGFGHPVSTTNCHRMLLNVFIGIQCICSRHSVCFAARYIYRYSVDHRTTVFIAMVFLVLPRMSVSDRTNGTKVLLPWTLQCRPAKCVHQNVCIKRAPI